MFLFFLQSDGAGQGRVCYQQGLTPLVYTKEPFTAWINIRNYTKGTNRGGGGGGGGGGGRGGADKKRGLNY